MMPKSDRPPAGATVKIDAGLLRKAKQVAVLADVKLTDYLDKLLRGPIERDHARSLRKIIDEQGGGNGE